MKSTMESYYRFVTHCSQINFCYVCLGSPPSDAVYFSFFILLEAFIPIMYLQTCKGPKKKFNLWQFSPLCGGTKYTSEQLGFYHSLTIFQKTLMTR